MYSMYLLYIVSHIIRFFLHKPVYGGFDEISDLLATKSIVVQCPYIRYNLTHIVVLKIGRGNSQIS